MLFSNKHLEYFHRSRRYSSELFSERGSRCKDEDNKDTSQRIAKRPSAHNYLLEVVTDISYLMRSSRCVSFPIEYRTHDLDFIGILAQSKKGILVSLGFLRLPKKKTLVAPLTPWQSIELVDSDVVRI